MKEIVVSILRKSGYELEERGDWLVAKKNGTRVNIGFISKGAHPKSELEGLEGKKVIVAMDGAGGFEGIDDAVVIGREELYEDFASVLFGEKDFESSSFYRMISSEERWEGLEVERKDDFSESIIRPFIAFEDVVELSKKNIKGFRYVLELVPHYIFHFHAEAKDGDGLESRSGLISVNALTGKSELWTLSFETVNAIDQAHKKLEPKLAERDALQLARKLAIESSKTVVESRVEREHAVVMERKVIMPRDDQLALEPKGLFYLPIWCVEGTNGVMIVNAAAGKIIEEDFYVK